MKNLVFSYYEDDLPLGCCNSKIYALLFDDTTNNALKFDDPTWSLQPFVKSSLSDFAIDLAEHDERNRYFSNVIDYDDYDIEKVETSEDIKRFTIEYWLTTGESKNRDEDSLLLTSHIFHDGHEWFTSNLGKVQIGLSSTIEAKMAIAFDSTNSLIKIISNLERNGIIDPNVDSCSIKIHNFAEEVIGEATLNTFFGGIPGVFYAEIGVASISPDDILTVECEINSTDDEKPYKTISNVVSYD